MAISDNTKEKPDPYYRPSVHARRFIDGLSAYVRPSHEELLYFMLCHKNWYWRLNTLAEILCPDELNSFEDEERVIVDRIVRANLQNAMSVIRGQLKGHYLEIREIKSVGDRRVKAYGIFDTWEPDSANTYFQQANWKRLHLDYSP